jgi:nitrite reductase/ring-hydroxylating ferredoxin subunit
MAKQSRHLICSIDEIDLPGSLGFSIEQDGQILEGFVVRHSDGVSAYLNHCPHTGASLNWMPDQFLSYDAAFIQCSIHGALFQLATGECVHGPCVGKSLEKLDVVLESGKVFIDLCRK